jgi:ribose 5-phosphate isomerase B
MKVAIACDHRGFEGKRRLLPVIKRMGHDVEDCGCDGTGSVDYPDYAIPVARQVAANQVDVGILLDGSGIGMSIVANKVPGVRAALAHDELTARRAREHNHCNVLCLGTDLLSEDQIKKIVEIFLTTPFGDGRHTRRVEKVREVERQHATRSDGGDGGATHTLTGANRNSGRSSRENIVPAGGGLMNDVQPSPAAPAIPGSISQAVPFMPPIPPSVMPPPDPRPVSFPPSTTEGPVV